MATGPEHYRLAEVHIANAQRTEDKKLEPVFLQYAQVHATLALVAATVRREPGPDSWALAIRESG